MTVGGVDTYYDYDEHQWKFRRLGGGPIHPELVCPHPQVSESGAEEPTPPPLSDSRATTAEINPRAADG